MQSPDSEIVKFINRGAKAAAPDNPFPWDRVLPGHNDTEALWRELQVFCQGYADNMADLEYLRGVVSMSDGDPCS